ncbi:hypothetical protein SAMN02787142_3059 [Burkholderia sp. WP9]|uniref:hypothetical protein n=1 Tax=Burkholderia sp. WP9 TaxID=1500263 RepID=UPI0008958D48|nr:hypothetical protein [Burkholderia sp. WP9]SED37448.1 hypothetical protein SAMN02787142_3059 [Burkholderia sp. WP9]
MASNYESATGANNSPSVSKHDICIQQAGIDFGIAHCLDGTTHWFRDDYSRSLRAAVKTTAQIFNGRRMVFSDHEQDDLTSRLKLCRSLPSPDREDVPVIDVLLRTLLPSHFSQLVSSIADRGEMGMFNRELFEQVCHEGARTQAVARAIQWQCKSSADGMRVKHAVETAFSSDESVLAYKVALLRRPFVPADKAAAYALHERAKGNELLFQQEMSGEKVHRQPDTLHRPSIALIQEDLHALQNGLDRAESIKARFRGGVITVNFSRVHGLYLGAVLLADGRTSADLASEVDRLWDEVTDGDGHVHQRREPQCSWAGLIEPHDTARKDALLLELECRALREKYVRAKGSEVLPTFTLIQPASAGVQSQENRHA